MRKQEKEAVEISQRSGKDSRTESFQARLLIILSQTKPPAFSLQNKELFL